MPDEADELTELRAGVAATASVCGEGSDATLGFPEDVKETELELTELDILTLFDRPPDAAWSIEFRWGFDESGGEMDVFIKIIFVHYHIGHYLVKQEKTQTFIKV